MDGEKTGSVSVARTATTRPHHNGHRAAPRWCLTRADRADKAIHTPPNRRGLPNAISRLPTDCNPEIDHIFFSMQIE